jgi:hypothetical protein
MRKDDMLDDLLSEMTPAQNKYLDMLVNLIKVYNGRDGHIPFSRKMMLEIIVELMKKLKCPLPGESGFTAKDKQVLDSLVDLIHKKKQYYIPLDPKFIKEFKEKKRIYNKKYNQEHREVLRAQKLDYYYKNKEKYVEKRKKYYREHLAEETEYHKRYYQEHKRERIT